MPSDAHSDSENHNTVTLYSGAPISGPDSRKHSEPIFRNLIAKLGAGFAAWIRGGRSVQKDETSDFVRTACPHCGVRLRYRTISDRLTAPCPMCEKPVPVGRDREQAKSCLPEARGRTSSRQPGEPLNMWKELRVWLIQGINVVSMLYLPLGAVTAIGFALAQWGTGGYFFAYFAAFYSPTFWLLCFHSSDHDLFKKADWAKGGIAVLALAVIHGALLLWGKGDREWEPHDRFFIEILPLFLVAESIISFVRARKTTGA